MPNDPCTHSTDSITLSLNAADRGLVADVRRSPLRGNPLVVLDAASGAEGVSTLDPFVGDAGGHGVNDGYAFLVQPQVPATLGVQIVWGGSFASSSRTPTIRLPGAGGDGNRKASLDWPFDGETFNVALPVADNTNPRIDRIVAQWSSAGLLTFAAKPGAPTAGATLDNQLGAAAVDTNSEVTLAVVQVDAGATQIAITTKIRDRRSFMPNVFVPQNLPTQAPGNVVPMKAVANNAFTGYQIGQGAGIDNAQVACLCRLDRDIYANYLYWVYVQTAANALNGNYVFALYDASRRFVLQTSAAAFSNAGVAQQMFKTRLSIAQPQILRAGLYYVMFGLTAPSGSGIVSIPSGYVYADTNAPNAYYWRGSGSTNPTTGSLDGAAIPFVDTWSNTANASSPAPAVPAISIGDV